MSLYNLFDYPHELTGCPIEAGKYTEDEADRILSTEEGSALTKRPIEEDVNVPLYKVYCPDRDSYRSTTYGYVSKDMADEFTESVARGLMNEDERLVPVSEWTLVGSYKEVPLGTWLVACVSRTSSTRDSNYEGREYHIMKQNGNIAVIGGHLAFERGRVLAYKSFGELLL